MPPARGGEPGGYRAAASALRAPRLLGLLIVTSCVVTPMNGLLAVLPIVAEGISGTAAAAGTVTAAISATAVTFELFTPRLVEIGSISTVMVLAFLLSALAALAMAAAPSLLALVGLGAIFGVGLGINVTVSSMLPARLIEGDGHGTAFGLFGIGASIPIVVAPPAALLIVERSGAETLFLVVAGVSMVGIIPVLLTLRGLKAHPRTVAGLERWRFGLGEMIAYGTLSISFGVVVGLVSFKLTEDSLISAAMFLLIFGVARTLARGLAARITVPKLYGGLLGAQLVAVAGLTCLAVDWFIMPLLAAVLFGLAHGASQTFSLMAMTIGPKADQTSGAAYWNFVTDIAVGFGALTSGMLAAGLGFGAVFIVLPVLAAFGALALHLMRSNEPSVVKPAS